MTIIRLTERGLSRVLESQVGMTFVVEKFTPGLVGLVAHVRDYRYKGRWLPYQIWSISRDGYELL